MRLDLIPRVLNRWGVRQAGRIRQAFVRGGHAHHGGSQWAPLAPSTIRRKGHATILVLTGGLANSFYYTPSDRSVVFGSTSNLAVIHQFSKRPQLPRREVIVATRRDIEEFKADLKFTLETGKESGFAT
jgi:phage gpG-like protein